MRKNKQVKKSAWNDKRQFVHDMNKEAERAARQNNMKKLYEIIRTFSEKNVNTNSPVREKQGKIITSDVGQRARWVEHFKEVLNRPPPPSLANIPPMKEELNINSLLTI